MMRMIRFAVASVAVLGLVAGCADDPSDVPVAETTSTAAPATTIEMAADAAEQPSVRTITGSVTYSDSFFTMGVNDPLIVLEDQSGFVERDRSFVIPVESQTLGRLTSDFDISPFTYSLDLPAEPQGGLHDVDNDTTADTGVMVYAVAYWTNTFGDAYLEERDLGGGGWSTAYASIRVSDAAESYLEVTGGRVLVYAPDAMQGFPTDFGPDAKLFTADDPTAPVPAGWSVVDLDTAPFTVSQPENAEVDLIEPDSAALDDFSALPYPEAFDAMVEKFRNEYAFTELKGIDWDGLATTFRPQVEAATTPAEFAAALDGFAKSIPDGHVGVITDLLDDAFAPFAGGLGIAIAEADDGTVVVSYVAPGSPAEEAGLVVGATVSAMSGQPIGDVVEVVEPPSGPFSSERGRRLQQLRYATRFPLDGEPVEVAYANPGGPERTVSLAVVDETDSLQASSVYAGLDGTELPVEFELLPSGAGYIRITSFSDDYQLTVRLWERALSTMTDYGVESLVIDLRANGGGNMYVADQMAAYFFDDRTPVGNTAWYDESIDDFRLDPQWESTMIPPPATQRFGGKVVAIVGPGCFSACEFFGYDLTVDDRATIVGYDATEGLGGTVTQFAMPEGIMVQITTGRAVDPTGSIHLEGIGVVPGIDVPRTVDAIVRQANGEDVLLAAAEEALG